MTASMSAEEFNAWQEANRPRGKYGARKVTIDGITFDSQAEARRYGELKHLRDAGEIGELECHPTFDLIQNGTKIGTYSADFRYVTATGETVVEDVKSAATRRKEAYRLRKRIVEAQYGISIREVEA